MPFTDRTLDGRAAAEDAATDGRQAEVVRTVQAGAAIRRGDRVLVRYGRFAGRVGEVEDVFRREHAGRERDVVWVRFGDRSVEGFDPKNLVKKGDHR